MKTMIFVLAALFLTGAGAQTRGKEKKGGPKILVAYFSWSGNTQHVAEQIAKLTGGDLFRVETKNPYPEEYVPCTEVAKEELEKGVRPELKGKVENFDQYDIIFVGCPVWWHTAPMAIWSFLESKEYDFKGKTVIPFCTSSSSELGESGEMLAEMAGTGDWQEGQRFRSGASESDVTAWVESLEG